MALYAFDGTWNIDEIEEDRETNVLRFCKALSPDYNVFYQEGVGTKAGFIGKMLGGLGVSGRRGAAGPPCLLLRSCRGDPAAAISKNFDPYPDPQRTILSGDCVHESVTPRGTMGGVVHLDPPAGVTVFRG
jgi:hypothetical protein